MAAEEDPDKKGGVWVLDQQLDQPIDVEAKKVKETPINKKYSSTMLLQLAFQSLGVVYGDLGTSPLYVFDNAFPDGIVDKEDVVGALSVIIWSLTFVPLLKYVFIVCRANDNGQGGTFALYSLLCRHAKIKSVPNQDQTDEEVTTFSRNTFGEKSFAARTKRGLEGHAFLHNMLLILVLIGSCMVIGDGILTPAISVLSAVGGMNVHHKWISKEMVVLFAVIILVLLFMTQQYGTGKVWFFFAPIVLIWLLLIGGMGIFNILKYDRSILKAFSPVYVYRYFKRRGRLGWESLGGIMLSINGTETLFADLNHFPVLSIQIAFTVVVFPCLLLAYCGQAAYLMKNSNNVAFAFYQSVPDSIYWPVYVIAIAAAIVASQSTITATFSLIKQALALGCFPRVKVIYTSRHRHQIYIPDVNWILMILCISVTAGFHQQTQIGNAAGTAVVIVMLVTTFLMILVMILVWRVHWMLVLIFTSLSLLVEGPYLSAVLLKVDQGGWAPLVIATAFFVVMYVWNYGTVRRYDIEMHSKVSMAWIIGLGPSLGLVRVPGIVLVYSELASGVPRIFSHFITNLPAIHSVVVFVCVKYLPVCTVPEEERFFVKRIGPNNFHMFRCIVRYGYKDDHRKDDDFEEKLFDSLFMFLRLESLMEASSDDVSTILEQQDSETGDIPFDNNMSIPFSNSEHTITSVETIAQEDLSLNVSRALTMSHRASSNFEAEMSEIEYLHNCRDAGVVHMMGNTVVRARRDSNFVKHIVIDYLYSFLRKICRGNSVLFFVPQESLLNVGQILYV
ncbi:PREDICTED: potassium transporter 10-like isoform X3 [Fragaria vesca subsp. vesca]|uniref:potassium transporter 10-like isoform X3 n=1 Tax=Fragaria vesca subsp. vesca TaxID=101020 RepID=UPI0002C36378|nr:PREDICTED: potassium transporter 10-like isoform X3 [Fragaria vesca subsp. vesca]XP_011460498.1 PREDICTED: potassium transporter 10-like isoform X1 [Fragaria vesca subsp. vesca]